ncbi:serine/threonine-protein kinase [Thermomonospora umbrina]|uniref:non-specific serine/threonine protein kinase n=1 Tax=Thermomonospora umbrina TaxID=111806 RepID=A0A3D9SIZ8_9ACTN|nr:serine/threonine-protein kinase [Thermomonospora umbrina]REE95879.1 serine/threonine-protein kinase [Thermomonospora umbrina]
MHAWRLDEFEEIRELGAGGQGRVVLARHPRSGSHVAIKYLIRADDDGAALGRLRDEALLLSKVADPHVVRLHRFVATEEGAALVMEAIDGVSLKDLLARHGALPPEAALVVLKGSLLGLAAAHAVGIVHRDYKPANVVVRADGLSKLIDFGIAAALDGAGSRSGSPAYMAPEQWEGRPSMPATDIYAATCVFFECVTGRRPFDAGERAALMRGHLMDAVPVEAVPEPLRPLVAAGMSKDAALRPPGATVFVAELERAAVTAYGPDWEQRGVRALAMGAVALASLFPLGAALTTPGAGAVGGATAATGTGLLAAFGGKTALAVAGATLAVGSVGVTAYAVSGGEDAGGGPPPVTVGLAGLDSVVNGVPVRDAQFVEIASGVQDPLLRRRTNAALRRPLDAVIAASIEYVGRARPVVGSTVEIGLSDPRLISARYELSWNLDDLIVGGPRRHAVTVNPTTGRAYAHAELWKPHVLTDAGTGTLFARLGRPWLVMTDSEVCVPGEISAAELFQGAGQFSGLPSFSVYFGATGLQVMTSTSLPANVVQAAAIVRCNTYEATVPYTRIKDLLRPEIAALLP